MELGRLVALKIFAGEYPAKFLFATILPSICIERDLSKRWLVEPSQVIGVESVRI